jgi:hypothetical protein
MRPHSDEVVVFRDFFATGLRFSLDPVVVEIFKLYNVFLHQMMLTSFLQLNLYMWLAKTCRLMPSAEGFAHAFLCHFQTKTMSVWTDDGQGLEVEPQFGVYTFAFYITMPSPIVAYKNKWPGTGPRTGFTARPPSTPRQSATRWC